MCTELRSPLPFYLKRLSTLLQLADPRVAFSSMPKPSPVASRSVLKRPARSSSMLKRPARCELNRPAARHCSSLQLQQPPRWAQHAVPKPKFKCGQRVLQWWAKWMKDVATSREQVGSYRAYNKKSQPKWFWADVVSFKEYAVSYTHLTLPTKA